MKVEHFIEILGADFYTGVPDSQLKALSSFLVDTYGADATCHVIAANEGNAASIAAGYHLATGKTAVVYLQNSGEGNLVNPLASLLNPAVYAIPAILVIGWRGEPGIHDEPQHAFQGEITCDLLDVMQIPYYVIGKESNPEDVAEQMRSFREILAQGRVIAFVIRKGGLVYEGKTEYRNAYTLLREEVIRAVTDVSGSDPIVATTGKAGRELFEIRVANGEDHARDFLTVGSMGHASSIALGIALQKPDKNIWCIDGDGAALMHMGAMAVIGKAAPKNMIHVIVNNEAHESVGGMPTAADRADLCTVAKACGYAEAVCVRDGGSFQGALERAVTGHTGPILIEVRASIGAREDLGRPTTSPQDNKKAFMETLRSQKGPER